MLEIRKKPSSNSRLRRDCKDPSHMHERLR